MRRFLLLCVLFAAAAGAEFWWLSAPSPIFAANSDAMERGGDAARGKLIFDAGGCASCHMTPGQDDRLALGGGYELKTAFGSFFAPNISSHPQDGIGRWTAADLVNAMQAGVSPSGEHYFPAFPYTTYAHAKPDDIRDLMFYLRALAPVAGKSKPHTLGFPFNVRRGVGLWKLANFDKAPIAADPGENGVRLPDESGLPSSTHFKLISICTDGTSLIECTPLTGRTNQIRAHLWELNLPIVGDPIYLQYRQIGASKTLSLNDPPLCLHAAEIEFTHPVSKKRVTFAAELPVWAK